MSKVSAILLSALMLLAFGSIWAKDNLDPITQGEFAVLLASNMNIQPPSGGWKPQTAAKFLANSGILPIPGAWNLNAKLKEGDLAYIMRFMGLNFFSAMPNKIVTWAKANALIGQFRDKFLAYKIPGEASDQTTTTHIITAVGGTPAGGLPPPASPSIP